MVERTRAVGIVNGVEGNPPLTMNYVSNLSDVQVGDRIVTSSIEGIYPKGFLIGYIERVRQGPNLYQEVQVRPTVDFNALDHVLVVMEPPRMQKLGESSQ
jgi:rod shape-determining protein MreC